MGISQGAAWADTILYDSFECEVLLIGVGITSHHMTFCDLPSTGL